MAAAVTLPTKAFQLRYAYNIITPRVDICPPDSLFGTYYFFRRLDLRQKPPPAPGRKPLNIRNNHLVGDSAASSSVLTDVIEELVRYSHY
jgi:hypothetical protein